MLYGKAKHKSRRPHEGSIKNVQPSTDFSRSTFREIHQELPIHVKYSQGQDIWTDIREDPMRNGTLTRTNAVQLPGVVNENDVIHLDCVGLGSSDEDHVSIPMEIL